MGWTGLYIKPPKILDFFAKELGGTHADGSKTVCLRQAIVGMTVYGAWQFINADGTKGITFATITLIRYGGKNDRCKFYYKDMDETVGPCEAKCPRTILELLKQSPASNEYARAWRKECWRYALALNKEGMIAKIRRMKYNEDKLQEVHAWNMDHPGDQIIVRYGGKIRRRG